MLTAPARTLIVLETCNGNIIRLISLFFLLSLSATAADWGLKVVRIEVGGRVAEEAMLQLALPGVAGMPLRSVRNGDAFESGTTLAAPARTLLVLRSSNGNEIRLMPGSRLRINAGSGMGEEYAQEEGESFFNVKRALNFFNVRYRNFQALVKGTRYSVKVEPGKQIVFAVEEGAVKVEREGKFGVDDGYIEGQTTAADLLKAGERRPYPLDLDEYLIRFRHLGEAEAYYRRQLEADRVSQNGERIEAGLQRLGVALLALSRYTESIPYFEEALELARQRHPSGVHASLAAHLSYLGDAFRSLGGTARLHQAISYYEESLDINRQLYPDGVHAEMARNFNNLGRAFNALGGEANKCLSIEYYERSLQIHRQLHPDGLHAGIAWSLNNLGLVYGELGGPDKLLRAIQYHQASLDLRRRLYPGRPHAETAGSLNNIGIVYRILGGEENIRQAIFYTAQSLEMKRSLYPDGLHQGIGASLANLGLAHQALGGEENLRIAIALHEESLALRQRLFPDDKHGEVAGSLNNLGRAHLALGGEASIERATAYLKESLAIMRRQFPDGPHEAIAWRLHNLGDAYLKRGDSASLQEAITYYTQCLAMRRLLTRSAPHKDSIAVLQSLARAQAQLGNADAAAAVQAESVQMEQALQTEIRSSND